jgi:hypothetical protein
VTRGIIGINIDGAGGLAWRASASFSASGQRPRDNTFLLDGVDNNESWIQSVVVFPGVDALEEFKLQTSTYAAEFGKSLGGVVNLQIRSGSNQFHGAFGSAPARSTLTTSSTTGPEPAPHRPHQFRHFGGPLKDRTFFCGLPGDPDRQGVNGLHCARRPCARDSESPR